MPGQYRLIVCGSTSIEDQSGNKLDGNRDGVGGDDFMLDFSVVDTNLPTSAPELVEPAANQVTKDDTPTFVWNSVPHGFKYWIQVNDSSSFTSPEREVFLNPGVLSYTSLTSLSNGKHYWRVRALNSQNESGPWSTTHAFTIDTFAPSAPQLSTPADDATVAGTPTYVWKAVATASAYQFRYGNGPDCESPMHTSPELTATKYAPPTQTPGEYVWCVSAGDAAGNWSAWSAPRTITIVPAVPRAPVLDSPANASATNDTTPTFTWFSSSYAVSYEIQVDDSSGFTSPERTSSETDLDYVVTQALPPGKYYWHVRAENINHELGPWSPPNSLMIDIIPPMAPILKTLKDAAATPDTTPSFTWKTVNGAKSCNIQIADNLMFSGLSVDDSTTSSKFTVPNNKSLPYGKYFWRVQAVDAAGNPSLWSETWSFDVTIQKAPKDGFVTTDTTPSLSWNSVHGALEYQIEIATDPDFANVTYPKNGLTGKKFTLPDAQPFDTYYWHIRARTEAGWSAWMPGWKLIIASVIPAKPTLLDPTNGKVVSSGLITFIWKPAVGAATYEIQVDNNMSFNSPEFTASPDASSIQSTELTNGTYYWRVRGISIDNVPGSWSSIRKVGVKVP